MKPPRSWCPIVRASDLLDNPVIRSRTDTFLAKAHLSPVCHSLVCAISGALMIASTSAETLGSTTARGSLNGPSTVAITEVMTDNDNVLEAADGSSPDWIELTNTTAEAIDIGGWYLTDNSDDLAKWSFPAPTLISGGGRIIVFASGDEPGPGELHASFSLSSSGEYLALVQADGTTVAQEFSPFLPALNEDVSYGLSDDLSTEGFFEIPTPGEANGSPTVAAGPVIRKLTENPTSPAPNGAAQIPVSVEVYPLAGSTVTEVNLIYRIGFDAEESLPMAPGPAPEWNAAIPTSALPPGAMLRWRVEATGSDGAVTPFPSNVPLAASPRYHGTVAQDPANTTDLPILHWFVEDPDWYKDAGWDAAAQTRKPNNRDWIGASISFQGRFYDNLQMRTRGVSAAGWAKPKFKVEMNEGDEFEWSPDAEQVDEFNLQSHFIDQFPGPESSYLREPIQQVFSREAGTPFAEMFFLHVRQNTDYFGLYSFTEQVDRTFLRRIGLEDGGALYKSLEGTLSVGDGTEENYRKSTRQDEPYDDLVGLIDSLNATGSVRTDFVYDHLELPAIINKIAVDAIVFNYDRINHNYYMYHQPGRDEWTQITWDTDLNLLVNGRFQDADFNHPLYLDGVDGRPFNGLTAAMLQTPAIREMYLRRLRTLMDTYLDTSYLDDLITGLADGIDAERTIDAQKWGITPVDIQRDLIDTYLRLRRRQLFSTYSNIIPSSAITNPAISIGMVETNPQGGNQDEEFIELVNPQDEAVDLSGWTLSGAVSYTFPPGSVIPAGDNCYVSPDVRSFRLRSASPTGGEQHLVLGNYGGHLSNFSEELVLQDAVGREVASITTPDMPSDNQLYLVISEVLYKPEFSGDTEFVEVLNTSDAITLDLSGVRFTSGISYAFPDGTMLAPGGRFVVDSSEFLEGTGLSNSGDTLKIDDADGSTITEFRYTDSPPWPTSPDTSGNSLVFRGGNPTLASSWRASIAPQGNPGESDSVPYLGGDLVSYVLSDSPTLDPSTMEFTVPTNPGADDAELTPEWSRDLEVWNRTDFVYLGSDSWQLNLDSDADQEKIFVRLHMEVR